MEYVQCLRKSTTNLKDPEIIAISLASDVNADGRIDYEEFMKHFLDMLKMVRVFQELQDRQETMHAESRIIQPSTVLTASK